MQCQKAFLIILLYIGYVKSTGINTNQFLIDVNYENRINFTFFAEDNQCSRYCIDPVRSQNISHLNVIWKSENISIFNGLENSSFKKSDRECLEFLKINCPISTNEHTEEEQIIEKNKLESNNSIKFDISNRTKMFLLTIPKTTWFLLECPIDRNKIESGLELSVSPSTDDERVILTAQNPPVGVWRLKISTPTTTTDSALHNLSVLAVKKYAKPDVLRKIDSPKHVQSREADSQLVILSEADQLIKPSQVLDKSARVIFDVNDDSVDAKDTSKLERITDDEKNAVQQLEINLAPETSLSALAGTIHPIIFSITNHLGVEVLHFFGAQSSSLQVVQVQPLSRYIKSQETVKVLVGIRVPEVNGDVNTLDLIVDRGQNFKVVKRSVYVYIRTRDTSITDYTNPEISHTFYDNCHDKTDSNRCETGRWSVEIIVTDSDSGLARVVSQPAGIRARKEFIAGTKSPTSFVYSSTCCSTKVQVTATDVAGNSYSRTIDVTAWDNLTTGEIAAIVVGCLLILLIIILLIILCIYCVKKQKSSDLTYTQRYGSRTTPGHERTTF